jgi:hypothetical protein
MCYQTDPKRLSKLSFKLFILTEVEPANLLLDKSRVVSTGSYPIESGIESVNLLLLRLKMIRDLKT